MPIGADGTYRANPQQARSLASSKRPKVTRDAFLFMTPKNMGQQKDFAQCVLCRMWVDEETLKSLDFKRQGGRCIAHGSELAIAGDDSCGLFIIWPTPNGRPIPHVVQTHAKELIKGLPASVTPKESGLVRRAVQCFRCIFAELKATLCGLYRKLNKELPDTFDLNEKITPNSCCNAQEPISLKDR